MIGCGFPHSAEPARPQSHRCHSRKTEPRSRGQSRQTERTETYVRSNIDEQFKEDIYALANDGNRVHLSLHGGSLGYSVYRVQFSGKYRVTNYTEAERELFFDFALPANKGASQHSRYDEKYASAQSSGAPGGVYDNFRFVVGGKEITNLQFKNGSVWASAKLAPGKSETVEISYGSQGMDEWWYDFGQNVSQAKNFSLTMQTDFDQIDFPQTSLSPTQKTRNADGWELKWQYANLLSGIKIGMLMPHKLNPGPWVSEVSFAAPVSLFLFFFVIFMLTTIKKIKLHPMNYFFIGAAFFSFHLLLAYLVDHVSIHKAFLICSAVSIFLVVSYLRLAVGNRFAFVEAGILQFVYLVLFSYTFFFERYTGLAITILCILTLFIAMQFTGRVDWDTLFRRNGKNMDPLIEPVPQA